MFGPTTQHDQQALTEGYRTPERLLAIGPRMPGFGSWEWIGADLAGALPPGWRPVVFRDEIPEADAVLFVKFHPPAGVLAQVARRSAVLYAPVDFYGSAAEIDGDQEALFRCDRILIHCERLRKYFRPYARVELVDHHVKYAAPLRSDYRPAGPLLWVGVRSNLPALAEWLRSHRLPGELWVLTNPEDDRRPVRADDFGLPAGSVARIEAWTAQRQRDWTTLARAALDIKGDDFRARHKPPAKALDFIASGLPLAMNGRSAPVEQVARMGFRMAEPDAPDRWLSREYWEETVQFGRAVRDSLSLERVGQRVQQIVDQAVAERG